jgi:predicted Zn-dependent protease
MIVAGILLLATLTAVIGALWGGGFDRRKSRIVRALADGELAQASETVDQWLTSSPNSAEAHYFKARIAWAKNDLATADHELATARTLGYDWTPLARLRGLLLARANRTSEAEPLLRDAFYDSRELDLEVAEALTKLYLGTFRLGEAAMILDRWSRERPDDARPYFLHTEIDTRIDAASDIIIARCRAALERDPGLDQARLRLAEELRKQQQNAEAAGEYLLYLARKHDDPLGYLGAGQNAVDLGEFAQATHFLDQTLALTPLDPVALAARGALEQRQGNREEALHYFDRAVKSDPFDHGNRYQRMLILASLGKKDEAKSECKTIERLKNDQARFDQITRELVSKPLDAQLRCEAANWLMEHGHEDEAVDWANLVLRSDPSHPGMNRLLADFYRKKGQLGRANLHEASALQHATHLDSTP